MTRPQLDLELEPTAGFAGLRVGDTEAGSLTQHRDCPAGQPQGSQGPGLGLAVVTLNAPFTTMTLALESSAESSLAQWHVTLLPVVALPTGTATDRPGPPAFRV